LIWLPFTNPLLIKSHLNLLWFNYTFTKHPYVYTHFIYMTYNLKFFNMDCLPRSLYRFTLRSLFKLTFTDFKTLSFANKRTYASIPARNLLTSYPYNFYVHNFDMFKLRVSGLLRCRKRYPFTPNRVYKSRKLLNRLVKNAPLPFKPTPKFKYERTAIQRLNLISTERVTSLPNVLMYFSKVTPFSTVFSYNRLGRSIKLPVYSSSNINNSLALTSGALTLFYSRKVRNFHLIATSLVGLKHVRLRLVNLFKRSYSPQASVYSLTSLFKVKNLVSLNSRITHDVPTSAINSFKYLLHFQSIFSNRRPAYFKISYMTRKYITPQRREFMLWFRKKLKYQKRITRYVLKFYKFKVLEFFNQFELNLTWILFKSRLVVV